jgi:hypothetical protein
MMEQRDILTNRQQQMKQPDKFRQVTLTKTGGGGGGGEPPPPPQFEKMSLLNASKGQVEGEQEFLTEVEGR